MKSKQIETLVNDLGRKLADRPDSVSLTEFPVLARTAVHDRREALLSAGARSQTAHAPSPETRISPVSGLQLVLNALAQAQGVAFQVELELASSRLQGEFAEAA